jgi:hypothetical protein
MSEFQKMPHMWHMELAHSCGDRPSPKEIAGYALKRLPMARAEVCKLFAKFGYKDADRMINHLDPYIYEDGRMIRFVEF